MPPKPVLVVHGVANRDKAFFEKQVATLQKGLGKEFDLIPAWWGGLGAPSDYIRRTTPLAEHGGKYETRGANDDTTEQEVDDILSAAMAGTDGEYETRSMGEEDEALRQVVAEAWAEVRTEQAVWTAEEMEAIGVGLAKAISEQEETGEFEVRSAGSVAKSLVKGVMKGVTAAWTSFKGTTLGSLQQDFRGKYLPMFTEFLGDIIVYQRHRELVQGEVRKALETYATKKKTGPLGTEEQPLLVIGHSLGGVISFDMAAAGNPQLWISKLVTMGSQPSFFHVIDPRDDLMPPRIAPYDGESPVALPKTIRLWKNFWEPLDPFAFVADKIFDGDFDVEVQHLRESGVYTHSDYWINKKVHEEIKMFLQ